MKQSLAKFWVILIGAAIFGYAEGGGGMANICS